MTDFFIILHIIKLSCRCMLPGIKKCYYMFKQEESFTSCLKSTLFKNYKNNTNKSCKYF